MIVRSVSTVSFRISSGGVRDRVTFAKIGNRLALHPQKNQGHQERANRRGGQAEPQG
jgi:hypothetical protein